ncbi:unnamed protein product [Rodentolepis nana]|uniref:Basal body-orientation factor 1 n=1 Tax=Rodentolepis nana TaxID=102285 RepID=A0A0R3T8A1_RODNA|nr:unnamed protein product [Rodentolepis nana]
MPAKLNKGKDSKKRKVKFKDTKSSKKKKNDSKKTLYNLDREAARSKALETRLYFQLADLNRKNFELQQARGLQVTLENALISFKETAKEDSAFTTLQHEYTVERLTDRVSELTIANTKLKEDKNCLQLKLEALIEDLNAALAAKEAEIEKLNVFIKESHYKYERVIGLFADRLVERLTESWESDNPIFQEIESLHNKLLYTFNA